MCADLTWRPMVDALARLFRIEFRGAQICLSGQLENQLSDIEASTVVVRVGGKVARDIDVKLVRARKKFFVPPRKREFRISGNIAGARSADGVQVEIPGASPIVPDAQTVITMRAAGAIDAADFEGIYGWASLPFVSRLEAAAIAIDGEIVVPIEVWRPRPDVFQAGAASHENVGFEVLYRDLPEGLKRALVDGNDERERLFQLVIDGRIVAEHTARITTPFITKIESVAGGKVTGWVASKEPIKREVVVEVVADGDVVAKRLLTQTRPDVIMSKGVPWACGFSVIIPCAPTSNPESLISVRLSEIRSNADNAETYAEVLPQRFDRRVEIGTARQAQVSVRRGVTIVIPIFNAADALERCLAAVVRHTGAPARLLLIDDASTDPRIAGICARYARDPIVRLLRNAQNQGFAANINLGVRESGDDDIVLLNSDVEVTPHWLEHLRHAAYTAHDIGSVTALSDKAGAFSVPEIGENDRPDWLEPDAYARLVTRVSALIWPETPTANGFCAYLKRECLDAVGAFDAAAFPQGYGEENDFSMRALRAGWRHIVDDRTLVYHARAASFGAAKTALFAAGQLVIQERYPDYDALVSDFVDGVEMSLVRSRIRAAVRAGPAGAPRLLPRVMFVVSMEAGGTPFTNKDLMSGLRGRFEALLLRCDSKTMFLHRVTDEGMEELETCALRRPINPITHRSAEYDETAANWMLAHAVELIHVRHISWHSLGLPDVAKSIRIPIIFSFHDFYAVCPTVKLLDENGVYCGGSCTSTEGECQIDLWPEVHAPPLKHRWVHVWRRNFARALSACDAFVTTSESARRVLTDNFPQLADARLEVIPHGRDFSRFGALGAAPTPGEPVRILVPGNITRAKGGELIRAVKTLDTAGAIEFHILGADESGLARQGIIAHGVYTRGDFLAHAEKIQPHFGVVFSLWPETYCHTLTELWAAGLPVLALDIGAVGERIAAHGGGWLTPHADENLPQTVFERIQAIANERDAFERKLQEVKTWQRTTARERTISWMASRYANLYQEVSEARRAFAGEMHDVRRPELQFDAWVRDAS